MLDSNDLLKKATEGTISETEVAEVVRALQRKPEEDPYTLLLIVGRSMQVQYRALVEKYLECSEDPMLARLALQILCQYWGLGQEHFRTIDRFMRGVTWDQDLDVRLMAISCMGMELREHFDRDALAYLLLCYRNVEEEQIIRESAYRALARAIGKSRQEIPRASRHFDLMKDIDPAVLQEVERRIEQGR